jgi:hypothetical protein
VTGADLAIEAMLIRALGASVIDATDIGTHAVELAIRRWKLIPLRGKYPRIKNPHPKGSWEHKNCKAECGQLGHGVNDATYDVDTVIGWWSGPYRGSNIGARIPAGMLLIDVDPRSGGHETWAALEAKYGRFPDCMMQISGRGDGGTHRFVRLPAGDLDAKRLGPGIDFKTSTGYAVMAPSIHPDSDKPYVRVDGPIPDPPEWFTSIVTVPPPQLHLQRNPRGNTFWQRTGSSPAERYNATMSWADVLMPHGWTLRDGGNPDGDGAIWLHPAHTSKCSATISNDSLYVYSTSTPFDVTEYKRPKGYSKFHAYAVLNHRGDMKAAARALKGVVW